MAEQLSRGHRKKILLKVGHTCSCLVALPGPTPLQVDAEACAERDRAVALAQRVDPVLDLLVLEDARRERLLEGGLSHPAFSESHTMERGRVYNPGSIHDVAFRRKRAVIWLLVDGPAYALVDPSRHREFIVVPDGNCLSGVVLFGHRGC